MIGYQQVNTILESKQISLKPVLISSHYTLLWFVVDGIGFPGGGADLNLIKYLQIAFI
jgi:hypothetical protein